MLLVISEIIASNWPSIRYHDAHYNRGLILDDMGTLVLVKTGGSQSRGPLAALMQSCVV